MPRRTVILSLLALMALATPGRAAAQSRPDAFLDYINGREPFAHYRTGIFLGLWTDEAAHDAFAASILDGNPATRVENPLSLQPFDQDVVVVSAGYSDKALDFGRVVLNHLEFPSTRFRVTSGGRRIQQTKMEFDQVICHSNGCVLLFSAIERGEVRAKSIVALGTDWLSRSFDPGSLGGAQVTFFRRDGDPVPRIPAPRWMRITEDTPGLGFTVSFASPAEIPGALSNLARFRRSDADVRPVIDLEAAPGPPDGGGPHNLRGYFSDVSAAVRAGHIPSQLQRSIQQTYFSGCASCAPGAGPLGAASSRGGISADVRLRPDDFKGLSRPVPDTTLGRRQ